MCDTELRQIISDMQIELMTVKADIKAQFKSQTDVYSDLQSDNTRLKAEVAHLKTVINCQATYIANLDSELDELSQYGRRENVVFSNLHTDTDHTPENQVMQLCKNIGVEIDRSDIVACHPLPSGNTSKPKRIIARFHDRNVAGKIFTNRKKAKHVSGEAKSKLAVDKDKGFGVAPNLTVKRGKLFGQVTEFNNNYQHDGCWVDPKTGKIIIKLRGNERGRVVKNTGDLVEINNLFEPKDWYFCAPPSFRDHNDPHTPAVTNVDNTSIFSPVEPSVQNTPLSHFDQLSRSGSRGSRGGRDNRSTHSNGHQGPRRGNASAYRPRSH